MDDASVSIAQRLTASLMPTKRAVCPAQTHYTLVRSSGLNCMIESLCCFWKVIGVHDRLPTMMLEIVKSHAAEVQKALIDVGRLAIESRCPQEGWCRFDDLT